MKNMIYTFFVVLMFTSSVFAAIDNRQYVDWGTHPEIVRIENLTNNNICSGTRYGDAFFTSTKCIEDISNIIIQEHDLSNKKTQVMTYDDIFYDFAVLIDETTSIEKMRKDLKKDLDEFAESDKPIQFFGFGDLRILSDEEIKKIREYLIQKNAYSTDTDYVLSLLKSGLPDMQDIFNDSKKLKMVSCNITKNNGNKIRTNCPVYNGDYGAGVFQNNRLFGIISKNSKTNAIMLENEKPIASVTPLKNIYEEIDNYTSQLETPDFLQNKMACDGKTRLADAILNNISKSLNKVKDLNKVKPLFEKYYYCPDAAMLMNSCGDLILYNIAVDTENIRSIEHKNAKYIIVFDGDKKLIFKKCKNYAPNEIQDILIGKSFSSWIYSIDDTRTDFSDALVSLDGGITFYKKENLETNGGYASVFTQEEIAKMPQELKQCLGIIK